MKISSLSFSYPKRMFQSRGLKNVSDAALSDFSIEIPEGKVCAILGPNGSGKSTLFKLLSTQLALQEGDVSFAGFNLRTQASKIRSKIGVCFQSASLDDYLTVEENLKIQAFLYSLDEKKAAYEMDRLLNAFSMQEFKSRRCKELSGGQRRKVEIAKALLHKPPYLFLDEPTTALDPRMRLEIFREIFKLHKEKGVSVYMSTHLMEEAELCHQIILIHKGKFVVQGSPEELKKSLPYNVLELALEDEGEAEKLLAYLETIGVEEKNIIRELLSLRIYVKNAKDLSIQLGKNTEYEFSKLAWRKLNMEDVFFLHTGEAL